MLLFRALCHVLYGPSWYKCISVQNMNKGKFGSFGGDFIFQGVVKMEPRIQIGYWQKISAVGRLTSVCSERAWHFANSAKFFLLVLPWKYNRNTTEIQ